MSGRQLDILSGNLRQVSGRQLDICLVTISNQIVLIFLTSKRDRSLLIERLVESIKTPINCNTEIIAIEVLDNNQIEITWKKDG